jgi:hypothetical protein
METLELLDVSSVRAQIRERLSSLVPELRESEAELTKRIDRLDVELAELKAARAELTREIRHLLGESANGSKPKKSKQKQQQRRSRDDTKDAVLAWLEKHSDELDDGFFAVGLVERPDFDVVKTSSSLSEILARLHAEGSITLHKVGGVRGRTKLFRLVGQK